MQLCVGEWNSLVSLASDGNTQRWFLNCTRLLSGSLVDNRIQKSLSSSHSGIIWLVTGCSDVDFFNSTTSTTILPTSDSVVQWCCVLAHWCWYYMSSDSDWKQFVNCSLFLSLLPLYFLLLDWGGISNFSLSFIGIVTGALIEVSDAISRQSGMFKFGQFGWRLTLENGDSGWYFHIGNFFWPHDSSP